jgi:hypothetical protein
LGFSPFVWIRNVVAGSKARRAYAADNITKGAIKERTTASGFCGFKPNYSISSSARARSGW